MAGTCVERMKHDDPKCNSTSKSLQIFLNDDDTGSPSAARAAAARTRSPSTPRAYRVGIGSSR